MKTKKERQTKRIRLLREHIVDGVKRPAKSIATLVDYEADRLIKFKIAEPEIIPATFSGKSPAAG